MLGKHCFENKTTKATSLSLPKDVTSKSISRTCNSNQGTFSTTVDTSLNRRKVTGQILANIAQVSLFPQKHVNERRVFPTFRGRQ